MWHVREVEAWFRTLERVTPAILSAAEFILTRVATFAIFLYGMWSLVWELMRAHGR